MKHIYVNFKRFDIPSSFGGVNRIAPVKEYASYIIREVLPSLSKYKDTEFVHFYPEAHLIEAVKAAKGSDLKIGCQGVYRDDVKEGGNFGAFTTNRPSSIVSAIGCTHTLIGHLEERNDKMELLALGGNKDPYLVNTILAKEVLSAQKQGLKVLYCVGERENELDRWDEVITKQLEIGLKGADLSSVVIAYEPVWSIGPGKTPADKPYIEKVASLIHSVLGPTVSVVYGGGLKEANAAMVASCSGIDGGLIALTRFSGEIGFYPDEYLKIVSLYLNGGE